MEIELKSIQDSEPFYSEANMAYVKKSVQELRAGKGTSHELIEADDERENNRSYIAHCRGHYGDK